MRLAACEAPAVLRAGDTHWDRFADRVRVAKPDIFVLNEMPFGNWVSTGQEPDADVLLQSRRHHSEGLERLADLGVHTILGTMPASEASASVNQAFVWTTDSGAMPVHTKQFFPDEDGFFEARWFSRGSKRFGICHTEQLKFGFLICTDVMFNEWARFYGRNGAQLIAVPRATPVGSEHRWKTMCSAAAIVSGCYVASSNRSGTDPTGMEFAGKGWIVDPFGNVLEETSPERPIVTADLDLSLVERAQAEYPCYVEEMLDSGSNRI
jgi:N-carbamoylputrescine amidase